MQNTRKNDPQDAQKLLELIRTDYPAFYQSVNENISKNPNAFKELSSFALGWAKEAIGADALEVIAKGYAYFVTDVNRHQIEYCIRGHYKNKSYTEVYDQIYNNDEYMNIYHWGVFATLFLWNHHLRIYDFYRDQFLPMLDNCANMIELGSGSGIWSTLTCSLCPNITTLGIDISKSSLNIAQKISKSAGVSLRASFKVGDALTFKQNALFDAGISCFLLEHLEAPKELMNNLAQCVKPGAPIFITAAITAAEVDHIYEFKNEVEVLDLLNESGFRILQVQSTSPEPDERLCFLPRSIAIIAVRKSSEHW